jgi:hypothetical protein
MAWYRDIFAFFFLAYLDEATIQKVTGSILDEVTGFFS